MDPISSALETLRSTIGLTGATQATMFEPRVERFLSRALVCRAYDFAMLSILLEVFKIHVTPVFPSFGATFHNIQQHHSNILPEQLLTMAAVGATFCKLPGSRPIAKVLFADSHRMLCNNFSDTQSTLTPELKRSHIQTLIALQLFGLCSGHKRAHELAEGYHPALRQAVHELHQHVVRGQGGDLAAWKALTDDVIMLECYRTTLFQQCPPLLSAAFLSDDDGDRVVVLDITPSSSASGGNSLLDRNHLLSWSDIRHLSRLSGLCAGFFSKSSYEALNRRWDYEKLDRILRAIAANAENSAKDISQFILCRTIAVSLCAPISDIEESLDAATTRADRRDVIAVIQNWKSSSDCVTALTHASSVIEAAQQYILLDRDSTYIEAPHDAHCIFLCGLVIWAETRSSLTDEQQLSPLADKWLPIAIRVLASLQVAVADNMKAILSSVISDTTIRTAS
jgi:hypothetical protein